MRESITASSGCNQLPDLGVAKLSHTWWHHRHTLIGGSDITISSDESVTLIRRDPEVDVWHEDDETLVVLVRASPSEDENAQNE